MSSNGQIIDFSRVRVQTPFTTVHQARFLYHGGRAAAWVIDKRANTATRVLLATSATFVKASRGRFPHILTLADDTEWLITQSHGGCGCGSNPLRGKSVDELLSDDLSAVP